MDVAVNGFSGLAKVSGLAKNFPVRDHPRERGSREKRYFLAGKKGGREEGGGEEGRKEGKREGRERRREEREDSIITSKHMTSMDIDTM